MLVGRCSKTKNGHEGSSYQQHDTLHLAMSFQSKIQRPDKRTRFSSASARQPDDGAVPAKSPACEVRADVSSVVVWPPCKTWPTKAHPLPRCRPSRYPSQCFKIIISPCLGVFGKIHQRAECVWHFILCDACVQFPCSRKGRCTSAASVKSLLHRPQSLRTHQHVGRFSGEYMFWATLCVPCRSPRDPQ